MFARVSWRIFLIIVSAAAIAYSVYAYLDSLQQTIPVYIAKEEIPAYTEITSDHLQKIEVEIRSAEALLARGVYDSKDIIGAITLQEVEKGRPLELDSKMIVFPEQRQMVLGTDGRIDLTYFIPKDKRLVTVALEPSSAVNNMLKQGDWVDVIFTPKSSDLLNQDQTFSNMILQQIEVFDIQELTDHRAQENKQGLIQHITLLVTPEEAIKLTLAKREGVIDLALNPWNGERERTAPIFMDELRKQSH